MIYGKCSKCGRWVAIEGDMPKGVEQYEYYCFDCDFKSYELSTTLITQTQYNKLMKPPACVLQNVGGETFFVVGDQSLNVRNIKELVKQDDKLGVYYSSGGYRQIEDPAKVRVLLDVFFGETKGFINQET